MPDVYGLPTAAECIKKIDIVAPVEPTAELLADVQSILDAVIAELEAPVGRNGSGGTGRRFRAVAETRYFDGTGTPRLQLDDIVPGLTLTVKHNGATLPDVQLVEARRGMGYNTLVRTSENTAPYISPETAAGVFPLGTRNISVQTTWGYAATAPKDIYEAVRCEVAFRALVEGYIDLAGAGEVVTLSEFTINNSAGVMVWAQTSPLAIFHRTWEETVARYRDTGSWRRSRIGAGIA
jgi:hypothetical protein